MPSPFDHLAHLTLAHDALRRGGLDRALVEVPRALRRIASDHGQPDKFDADLTRAWLQFLSERWRSAPDLPLARLIERYPELMDPGQVRRCEDPPARH